MLALSLWFLVAIEPPFVDKAHREDTDAKKADALIARIMDTKASWDDRCVAEDKLAKLKPDVVLPRLLKHAAKPMPSGGIYNSAGRESDKNAPVQWQIWYAVGDRKSV